MWAILIGRVECGLTGRQRKDQPAMACIHRLEPKNVPEEGAVRFRIFSVNDDVSTADHVVLLPKASPTKKSTGVPGTNHRDANNAEPRPQRKATNAGLKPGVCRFSLWPVFRVVCDK